MSRTVWKFSMSALSFSGAIGWLDQEFDMPYGAVLRHAAATTPLQIDLWFEVRPNAPKESRTFATYGTGDAIPDGLEHRATVVAPNRMVWHIYEAVKP